MTKIPSHSLLRSVLALTASVAALTAATTAHAQGFTATGLFSDTPNGGPFNYVIALKNTSASTSLGTFWFAWIPGQFFLPSVPTGIVAPSGWTGVLMSGSGRNSIEFTANSTASNIQPGASLNFGFTSTDTPATMAGPSAVAGDAVGLSTVYSGDTAFSGSSFEFNVTPVPEPSSLVLMAIGSLGVLFAVRQKARRATTI